MSNSSNIICPNCKHEFPIGNALTQQIETDIRNKYLKVYNDDKQKLEAERAQINKLMEQAKTDAENQEKIITEIIKRFKQENVFLKSELTLLFFDVINCPFVDEKYKRHFR